MTEKHLDIDLLKKIHQGATSKNEVFTIIVKHYGPLLYPQIQRLTKNREWTKDCLQNVFIKVFEKIESFKGESTIYSWLFRIAHNETLNFLEKENRRTGKDISEKNFEILAGNYLLDQIDGHTIQQYLEDAIESLPEKQAKVFELHYFQEKKFSEISVLTGVSEGGLKANYHHAVKKIEFFLIQRLNQI